MCVCGGRGGGKRRERVGRRLREEGKEGEKKGRGGIKSYDDLTRIRGVAVIYTRLIV